MRSTVAAGYRWLLSFGGKGSLAEGAFFSNDVRHVPGGMPIFFPSNHICELKNSSRCYRCAGGLGGAADAPLVLDKGRSCLSGNVSALSGTDTALGWAIDFGLRQAGASQTLSFGGDCMATIGVDGIMPRAEFEARSRGDCFGKRPLMSDPGRNCPQCMFVIWDAPALTHVLRTDVLLRVELLGGARALAL